MKKLKVTYEFQSEPDDGVWCRGCWFDGDHVTCPGDHGSCVGKIFTLVSEEMEVVDE